MQVAIGLCVDMRSAVGGERPETLSIGNSSLLAIIVWQFLDLERSLLDARQLRPDELGAP